MSIKFDRKKYEMPGVEGYRIGEIVEWRSTDGNERDKWSDVKVIHKSTRLHIQPPGYNGHFALGNRDVKQTIRRKGSWLCPVHGYNGLAAARPKIDTNLCNCPGRQDSTQVWLRRILNTSNAEHDERKTAISVEEARARDLGIVDAHRATTLDPMARRAADPNPDHVHSTITLARRLLAYVTDHPGVAQTQLVEGMAVERYDVQKALDDLEPYIEIRHGRYWLRGVDSHLMSYPPGWTPPGPEAMCSVCHTMRGTRADGTIRSHSIAVNELYPRLGVTVCLGVGKPPTGAEPVEANAELIVTEPSK